MESVLRRLKVRCAKYWGKETDRLIAQTKILSLHKVVPTVEKTTFKVHKTKTQTKFT